ncbi:MFS transporter [Marinoscillum sp.]|uniref:MFS transporter n=1 Tax=Marinoscillum sp. TaxID=2024838 RepID=UPI003BAD8BFD
MKQGLRKNWRQFTILVIINAFVGGMVGLERTILPGLAQEVFLINSTSVILSFIVVFGVSKAITNYLTGALANRIGRKNLLVIGWLVALPVPVILIYAPLWSWVVFANVLLGISQGLTWSSTVVMKIDLVGPKNRGLAMGLNESAGYLAVGAVAYLTGMIADGYGVRPYPFYMGIGFGLIGLLLSWVLVSDTGHLVEEEGENDETRQLKNVFVDTTWRDRNLGAITQAGLINNLNDGMMWGVLPLFLALKGFELRSIGQIVAIYPVVWGLGQLFTGKLADLLPKKAMLFYGMAFQGLAIVLIALSDSYTAFATLSVVLGVSTAVVYPTFLASISAYTHPSQRAASVGVFRLWRDLGYAAGAIFTGVVADLMSLDWAVIFIGVLTLSSAVFIAIRMENRGRSK